MDISCTEQNDETTPCMCVASPLRGCCIRLMFFGVKLMCTLNRHFVAIWLHEFNSGLFFTTLRKPHRLMRFVDPKFHCRLQVYLDNLSILKTFIGSFKFMWREHQANASILALYYISCPHALFSLNVIMSLLFQLSSDYIVLAIREEKPEIYPWDLIVYVEI